MEGGRRISEGEKEGGRQGEKDGGRERMSEGERGIDTSKPASLAIIPAKNKPLSHLIKERTEF